jgi:hypothetical protein
VGLAVAATAAAEAEVDAAAAVAEAEEEEAVEEVDGAVEAAARRLAANALARSLRSRSISGFEELSLRKTASFILLSTDGLMRDGLTTAGAGGSTRALSTHAWPVGR